MKLFNFSINITNKDFGNYTTFYCVNHVPKEACVSLLFFQQKWWQFSLFGPQSLVLSHYISIAYLLIWFHNGDRYGRSSFATSVIIQSLMKWKEELHNTFNHNSSVWDKPWKRFSRESFERKFHQNTGLFRSCVLCEQWYSIYPLFPLQQKCYLMENCMPWNKKK